MFSFKHKKVMKRSDPKHFDTILPFLQPTDVPHIKNFWYVVAPDAKRLQYQGRIWQVPVMRGTAKSTNHGANVIDMPKQFYDKP
jgi:hypothetical protein